MQINTNNSQNFKAIHAQVSKMNRPQRLLTSKITDLMSYSDSYVKLKDANIDLCILPHEGDKVKVLFLDSDSEGFVKTIKDKVLEATSRSRETVFDTADRITEKIDKILSGKCKVDDFDIFKIKAGDTDKARLFSEFEEGDIDHDVYCIASRYD